MELRTRALAVFCLSDPNEKAAATMALTVDCDAHDTIDCAQQLRYDGQPGRPARPELVHPQQVPRRSPFTAEGHSALVHSIAHIEFNAIKTIYNECTSYVSVP